MRTWTTAEEEALICLSHLGTAHLAVAFERSRRSIQRKAQELRYRGIDVSLRRRRIHGHYLGTCSEAALQRVRKVLDAELCPSCGKLPVSVRKTGLCWRCHLEGLRLARDDEIARLDGIREVSAGKSRLQRRRRALDSGSPTLGQ